MNQCTRALALAAALGSAAVLASPADAQQTNGLYIAGGAGLNWLRDAETRVNGAGTGDTESDLGWAGIGAVGWGFGNGFRIEGELGYRENEVDRLTNSSASGDISSWSVLGNVLYDFNTGTKFTPYIGAGLGIARVMLDARAGGTTVDDSDSVVAFQGIGGVAYALTDMLKLDLSYRYLGTTDPNFHVRSTNASMDTEYQNHTLLLSLRYEFGAPRQPMMPAAAPAPAPAPAPMAQAAPAPAPAAPAIQRSYLVFFDFDRSDITAEARRVIQQAATNARSGNVTRIQATGHADRAGSDRYNQALSLRRANAVKDELVRSGIQASQIAILGKGEAEPLVPTADGVREPQNRRVEILLQ
jgi:OmpA-OmpF porin, OOP family